MKAYLRMGFFMPVKKRCCNIGNCLFRFVFMNSGYRPQTHLYTGAVEFIKELVVINNESYFKFTTMALVVKSNQQELAGLTAQLDDLLTKINSFQLHFSVEDDRIASQSAEDAVPEDTAREQEADPTDLTAV